MSRIIAWFVHNPVASNLLMLVLVLGGLVVLPTIYLEEFPNVDTDVISISVVYRGAAPEESEQGVCLRIEEAIEGTPGIDRIISLAVEGACTVMVELQTDADDAAALDDIKNRVDAISTFPVETEKPVVSMLVILNDVMQIALYGDIEERPLRELGQQVRTELSELPGISQVELSFSRNYEISIEVSEQTLRQYGLTFDQVAQAVRSWSLDMPGGSVKAPGGEILLRTKGQAYWGEDYANVIVLARNDGTTVTLGEIALIRDGFEDVDLWATFEGKPAVLVDVRRHGNEDIIAIAEAIDTYLEELGPRLPAGVKVRAFNRESDNLSERLSVITGNGIGGLILVLIILGLFLRFRVAMWVAAGVPISLLGALMSFPTFDLSISSLSVLAFLLVIGILVDDAIVIGESVYSHERMGEKQIDAAIKGTQAVYVPVVFGVATTIAAFMPLLFVPGRMGIFFWVIGSTAIICLFYSLIESQFILPGHLAHRKKEADQVDAHSRIKVMQRRLSDGLERFGAAHYGGFLRRVTEWRYVTIAVAFGILTLSGALFLSGALRYQFFPPVEGEQLFASLTLPPGTPVEITEQVIGHIQEAGDSLRREIDEGRADDPVFLHSLVTVGGFQKRDGPQDFYNNRAAANQAEASFQLIPQDDRDIATADILDGWRERTGVVPDAVALTFSAETFSLGDALRVQLRGGTLDDLRIAAQDVRELLAGYAGVKDITDSFRDGKQEVKLALRPDAHTLGISLRDLGTQVRQAFYGEEVQRIQRGREDVRVMLRYPKDARRTLGALEDMRIRLRDGTEVPFLGVAEANLGRGYSTIRRTDRKRVVDVTATVNRQVTTPESVIANLGRQLPRVVAAYPGMSFEFGGEQRESGDAIIGLLQGLGMAMLVIFGLLAIPLKSWTQPLIIMSVIPFGAAGAVWGHLLTGWDLVFFSLLGIVALSGVVVNASLVLVHYVNRRRDEGVALHDAVLSAGIARFRPIVLTSATTFMGLVPLMTIQSVQTRVMVPMAVSLAFGVLFASTVSLLLVPSLYLVLEDVTAFLRRFAGAGVGDDDAVRGAGAGDGDGDGGAGPGGSRGADGGGAGGDEEGAGGRGGGSGGGFGGPVPVGPAPAPGMARVGVSASAGSSMGLGGADVGAGSSMDSGAGSVGAGANVNASAGSSMDSGTTDVGAGSSMDSGTTDVGAGSSMGSGAGQGGAGSADTGSAAAGFIASSRAEQRRGSE